MKADRSQDRCLDCKAEAGTPHAKYCAFDACHRFGLWCCVKNGVMASCSKDTPGAFEDLGALTLDYQWDKAKEEWIKR